MTGLLVVPVTLGASLLFKVHPRLRLGGTAAIGPLLFIRRATAQAEPLTAVLLDVGQGGDRPHSPANQTTGS